MAPKKAADPKTAAAKAAAKAVKQAQAAEKAAAKAKAKEEKAAAKAKAQQEKNLKNHKILSQTDIKQIMQNVKAISSKTQLQEAKASSSCAKKQLQDWYLLSCMCVYAYANIMFLSHNSSFEVSSACPQFISPKRLVRRKRRRKTVKMQKNMKVKKTGLREPCQVKLLTS